MNYIYDIEVYPNFFLFCSKCSDTSKEQTFEVSDRRDDRNLFALFLSQPDLVMIGFNNLAYDYPIIHDIITKWFDKPLPKFLQSVYRRSGQLIKSNRSFIKDSDYICKQIDLFKINHFDNFAKACSLKELEFNFQMTNIQELPFDPDKPVSHDQMDLLIQYCHNDVNTTYKLYEHTLPEIELRKKMTEIYKQDFTNYNSTKIGESILVSSVESALGSDKVYEMVDTGTRVVKRAIQSPVESINLNEIIFPYIVFVEPCFKALLSFFKSQTIEELAGAFSKIPESKLEPLKGYYVEDLTTTVINDERIPVQRSLNVKFKDCVIQYGVGGAHACIAPGVYESNEEQVIYDLDVTSFYPNIAIQNKLYPKHYGKEFCNIYEGIFLERKKYKKGTAENLAYKLALNGSYGKSNSEYSPLYSPEFTVSITINGQLLLSMLIERVLDEIPDAYNLQVNTDGATFMVPRSKIEKMEEIKSRWENYTKLELEGTIYSKMIIVNVSNYIAVKESGAIKRKGAIFIYKDSPGELEIYKNHSALVVPKTLEKYFVEQKSVHDAMDEFLHTSIYDFCLRSKVKKTDTLVQKEIDENGNVVSTKEVQRINRYIITGEFVKDNETKSWKVIGKGSQLVKVMKPLKGKTEPREINLEAGYLCTIVNDWSKIDQNELVDMIYLPYYELNVQKVIDRIENGHQ